ncbi:hypothetical protein T11_9650 [Trichinella zimbabwensis]|uniref:Uncharacterized protein n=1 Tax=Trichinella zimbabwensis TaxID=268475 RepID=A0A0V1I334_9BILA|nr:hypothetical protein T11_9650 [Trichinella zimbabwensis]
MRPRHVRSSRKQTPAGEDRWWHRRSSASLVFRANDRVTDSSSGRRCTVAGCGAAHHELLHFDRATKQSRPPKITQLEELLVEHVRCAFKSHVFIHSEGPSGSPGAHGPGETSHLAPSTSTHHARDMWEDPAGRTWNLSSWLSNYKGSRSRTKGTGWRSSNHAVQARLDFIRTDQLDTNVSDSNDEIFRRFWKIEEAVRVTLVERIVLRWRKIPGDPPLEHRSTKAPRTPRSSRLRLNQATVRGWAEKVPEISNPARTFYLPLSPSIRAWVEVGSPALC